MTVKDDLEWGAVVIEEYFDEPRIGYYDDDEVNEFDEEYAIVYPGNMLLSQVIGHYEIPYECLRPVTTDDLWKRRDEIYKVLLQPLAETDTKKIQVTENMYERLLELALVDSVLMERIFVARLNEGIPKRRIFISHASKDKKFARWLSVDLANAGHKAWLDEWDIKAGESIPKKIGDGIIESDFVVVVLTGNAIQSKWVEQEWHAKYWDEIQEGDVLVIPALFEDCNIPPLLKHKKYADFRSSYRTGFDDLLLAIK